MIKKIYIYLYIQCISIKIVVDLEVIPLSNRCKARYVYLMQEVNNGTYQGFQFIVSPTDIPIAILHECLVHDQAVFCFLPAMISMLSLRLRHKGRFLSSLKGRL